MPPPLSPKEPFDEVGVVMGVDNNHPSGDIEALLFQILK
jgi:hypothetical protein